MLLGYARVSTADQNLDGQTAALVGAGVDPARIHSDRVSGANADPPGQCELKRSLRPGNVVVIARLDRLGRSLVYLLDLVRRIEATVPVSQICKQFGGARRMLHRELGSRTEKE